MVWLCFLATLMLLSGAALRLNQPAMQANHAMASGDYQTANTLYAEHAAGGNANAQNALANLSYLGLGVPQDFSKAAHLYFAAAQQGHASAQLNLGNMYKQGLGVPFDAMRAFAWYSMSDMHGNPAAEIYLRQIAVEYTLSPLQIDLASTKWRELNQLVAEGL